MPLFDAHCHLQDARLLPHLDTVMRQASEAGVTRLMCCGSHEQDWPLLPDIADRFPGVSLSFGLHPWYIGARAPGWLDRLKAQLTARPSAVGEIGLDHALAHTTFADQESVFLDQIHLANELKRPVTFHCRRAWGRMKELLDEAGWPAYGFVLHSYSGSAELVEPLTRRGAFFSFSGALTFEQNRKGREALEAVPLDRLLIETDAPDMLPQAERACPGIIRNTGKPINTPGALVLVARTVAALRRLTLEEVAAITCQNASTLWGGKLQKWIAPG